MHMCADEIYLQRRIQTATENILNQLTRDVDIQIREIKKKKLSDLKQILEFTQDAEGRK